jgi:hypothetical protein
VISISSEHLRCEGVSPQFVALEDTVAIAISRREIRLQRAPGCVEGVIERTMAREDGGINESRRPVGTIEVMVCANDVAHGAAWELRLQG